jgi:V8-like Glu-specific endopeptidase
MLAPGLMITNQHCISSQSELESALVDFDYDSETSDTLFTRLSQLVVSNHDLDYSIVKLSETIERPPLRFAGTPIATGDKLIVIQHPGGEPKQVSVEDCAVGTPFVMGRTLSDTDFEHLCDTQTGSSGSPVIDNERHLVVGLHHLGFEEDNNNLLNRAVHIDRIQADIETRLGPLDSIIDTH